MVVCPKKWQISIKYIFGLLSLLIGGIAQEMPAR